jgi:hypothetical protein
LNTRGIVSTLIFLVENRELRQTLK